MLSGAGLLREVVQLHYAQYCKIVRERLLIDQKKQSVNIQDLFSGGRGVREVRFALPCPTMHNSITQISRAISITRDGRMVVGVKFGPWALELLLSVIALVSNWNNSIFEDAHCG